MDEDIILITKIIPPALPTFWIRRPRLLQALSGSQLVTLMSHFAGTGKTLLLADYSDYVDQPVAWLSLDNKDNSPGRLLRYLAASFQHIGLLPEQSCDTSRDIPTDQWETVTNLLSNCLRKCEVPHSIVLDNLEHVRSAQALKILQTLMAISDHRRRWFLLARGIPAIQLGKLRTSSRLSELTVIDMAFSVSEIESLCTKYSLKFRVDELYQLQSRSSGWITAVQLWLSAYEKMSSSMPCGVTTQQVVRLTYEYLAHYFIEEMLSPLNNEQKRFMRHTIVADRFNVELANVLFYGGNAKKLLPQLVRAGVCIVTQRDNDDWYRYPGLMSDVLSRYWMKNHQESLIGLRNTAFDWYLKCGMVDDAIYQVVHGGDIDQSLNVMQENLDDLVSFGLARPAERRDLDVQAANTISNDTNLTTIDAVFAMATDDSSRGNSCIRLLERNIRETDNSATKLNLRAMVSMLRCLSAYTGGNCRHSMDLSTSALLESHEISTVTSAIKFMEARSAFSLGLLDHAARAATQALREFQQWRHTGYCNKIAFLMVQIQLAQGRIPEAIILTQDSMVTRTGTSPKRDYFRIHRDLSLALIQLESHKLEKSKHYFQRAMNAAADLDHPTTLALCYYHLGSYFYTCRDYEKVIELCREGRRIGVENQQSLLVRLLDTLRTRVALRQSDIETCRIWMTRQNRYIKQYGADTLPEEKSLYPWIQMELNNLNEAIQFSNELIHAGTREGHAKLLIDMHLLQARVSGLSKDTALSCASLNKAVSLARQTGLIRAFCESTPTLIEQLKIGIGKKRDKAEAISSDNVKFVEEVLLPAMISLITPEHVNRLSPLADLTKRELDVLDLLTQDKTNLEIGETLYIGISTVKTHVHNIFGKLNVENRKEAIKKAQSAQQESARQTG